MANTAAGKVHTTAAQGALRINEVKLTKYLKGLIKGFAHEIKVRQFPIGQSNPTYQLIAGSKKYVLRKKPPGKLLPSAHAIDREYRVISALKSSGVPVPATLLLCQDPSIIGTEFFIMLNPISCFYLSVGFDSIYRTFRFTHSAIYTLVRFDYKHVFTFIKTIYRTHFYTVH